MILEVTIGLLFVYLFFSLVVTAAQEFVAAVLQKRANFLKEGIAELLHDRGFTGKACDLYGHPLIASLSQKASGIPSYIPTPFFVSALIDMIAGDKAGTGLTIEQLREKIKAMVPVQREPPAAADPAKPAPRLTGAAALQRTLLVLLNEAGEGEEALSRFRQNVQKWYDESMERVSGWYKKHAQFSLFLIGLVLATSCNVDSLHIISALSTNPKLRESLVAQATEYAKKRAEIPPPSETSTPTEAADAAKQPGAPSARSQQPGEPAAPAANPARAEEAKKAAEQEKYEKDVAEINAKQQRYENALAEMNGLKLPIGWGEGERAYFIQKEKQDDKGSKKRGWFADFLNWISGGAAATVYDPRNDELLGYHLLNALLGWLLTALAASMGAPFWFDLLGKVVTLRAAGRAPDEKDRISQRTPDKRPPPAGGIGDVAGV